MGCKKYSNINYTPTKGATENIGNVFIRRSSLFNVKHHACIQNTR